MWFCFGKAPLFFYIYNATPRILRVVFLWNTRYIHDIVIFRVNTIGFLQNSQPRVNLSEEEKKKGKTENRYGWDYYELSMPSYSSTPSVAVQQRLKGKGSNESGNVVSHIGQTRFRVTCPHQLIRHWKIVQYLFERIIKIDSSLTTPIPRLEDTRKAQSEKDWSKKMPYKFFFSGNIFFKVCSK